MVEITGKDLDDLTDAVQLWTGYGKEICPRRSDQLLIDKYGEQRGTRLLGILKSLEDLFYSSNAHLVAADLEEMDRLAVADFKNKQPSIPDAVAQVFAWCYTFDYK